MDIELTKESKALICLLYKHYLDQRKAGKSIEMARYLGHDTVIQKTIAPKWPLDDVTELCWSLERKGLVQTTLGEDRANNVTFTDKGIIYMESRGKNVLKTLMELSKIVLPWK